MKRWHEDWSELNFITLTKPPKAMKSMRVESCELAFCCERKWCFKIVHTADYKPELIRTGLKVHVVVKLFSKLN